MCILLYLIDEPHIPVITEDDIFPVPIKPNFIVVTILIKLYILGKKKAPLYLEGLFKFNILIIRMIYQLKVYQLHHLNF